MRTPIKVIMQRKLAFTFCVIMLALFVMVGVAAVKAGSTRDEYSKKVLSQMGYGSRTIPYQRGNITDRNGVILATNEVNYNLILDPSIITSNEAISGPTIQALVDIFGGEEDTAGLFTQEALYARIYADENATYIRYKKGLTEDQREAFVSFQESVNNNMEIKDWIKGVWFETTYKRIYPYDTLACDIIGFSSGEGSIGNYGIEQYYNDELIGTNGQMYGYLNQDSLTEVNVIQPVNGYTVVSTIDSQLQRIIEANVQEFWDSIGAKSVAVIAMDPNTGEVLANVDYPNYNLNDPDTEDLQYDVNTLLTAAELESLSEEDADKLAYSRALDALWKNYTTTTNYEPGSTMKPLTVAAGLEEGKVTPLSTFVCKGAEIVDGEEIECHVHPLSHGTINLRQAVVSSCNPALMQISFRMGTDLLSQYQEFWGFGAKTGVDLPYEDAGLLIDGASMTKIDGATNAFGQNMNVTIMQMAAAYSSVINGGTYYQPHVVKQIISAEGQIVENITPTVVRETVSKDTSEFLKDAMRGVLENSSAWMANDFEGYPVGGKTGTAEKYPRGNGKYVVSLASFEPYDDPNLFIMVVIDEPHVEDQSSGGYTTKLANAIWHDVIEYRYNVELDPVEEPETPESGENGENPGGEGENGEGQESESQPAENPDDSQSADDPSGESQEGGEPSTEVPITDRGENP
ncbi:MAG: penicillin-binding protein 2 [Lachnospiraceae bacterium]|nr:penicillin-binding protein 2 [Lachnospiraceae bacterium]